MTESAKIVEHEAKQDVGGFVADGALQEEKEGHKADRRPPGLSAHLWSAGPFSPQGTTSTTPAARRAWRVLEAARGAGSRSLLDEELHGVPAAGGEHLEHVPACGQSGAGGPVALRAVACVAGSGEAFPGPCSHHDT